MKKLPKILIALTLALSILTNATKVSALIPIQVNQGGTGQNTITGIVYGNGIIPLLTDSQFTRNPTTHETHIQRTQSANLLAEESLGSFLIPGAGVTIVGALSTITDQVTGDSGFSGTADLSTFGYTNEASLIGHVQANGDVMTLVVDDLAGIPIAQFNSSITAGGSSTSTFTPNGFDVTGNVNGTNFNVNDATQKYTLNKLGGGGTQLVTANNAGILGVTAIPTGGLGDVIGPASATDHGVALYDGITGKLLQNSFGFVQLANGNVGIGTTNPVMPLEINFSSADLVFGNITGDLVSIGNTNLTTNNLSGIIFNQVAGANGLSGSGIAGVNRSRAGGSRISDLAFYGYAQANGIPNEKMRILGDNGNVGIGTTVPGVKLDVNGNVRVFDQTAVTGATTLIVIAGAGQATGAKNLQEWQNNGGSIIARVSLNGDLISNSSIITPLFLSGGGDLQLNANAANKNITLLINSAERVRFSNTNQKFGNGYTVSWSADTTPFGTQDVGISRFSAGVLGIGNGTQGNVSGTLIAGNVGIGTTSPTAKLMIAAGTATANTAPLKFTSGVNLTTAETGAMEYNGTNLFFTPTGTLREAIFTGGRGSITLTAGTTTTVTDATAKTTSTIMITPTNLGATLGTLRTYVSTKNNGSFVLTTVGALGTEQYDYLVTN